MVMNDCAAQLSWCQWSFVVLLLLGSEEGRYVWAMVDACPPICSGSVSCCFFLAFCVAANSADDRDLQKDLLQASHHVRYNLTHSYSDESANKKPVNEMLTSTP